MATGGTTLPGEGGSTLAGISLPAAGTVVWVGQTVTFTAYDESANTQTSYDWDFGDGSFTRPVQIPGSGRTVTHAYTRTGTYTVTVGAQASGCEGSTATVDITVVSRPTVTLSASRSSIVKGETVTLTWRVSGGSTTDLCQLQPSTPASGGTNLAKVASQLVQPVATTTYTMTVSNSCGSVSASCTVTVNDPPPPTLGTFTAASASLNVGQGTTLAWTASNPSMGGSLRLTLRAECPGDSLGQPSTETVPTGTSLAVKPGWTTTYTLTAANDYGSQSRQLTVVVVQKPSIEAFYADRTLIQAGESVKLSWGVANGQSLSLNGTAVTGNSLTVSPATTTTYRLTAGNAAGSVIAEVKVFVASGAPGSLVWKRSMVYGFGQLLAEEVPEADPVRYIQSDQVGTPNRVLDSQGNVVGRSKNLPFGERFGSTGYRSSRRYTNHEETDDFPIYMQARTYLPAYGKFAQVDPAYDQAKDDPETWNLYNYVTNNPVTNSDPDGRARMPFDHIDRFAFTQMNKYHSQSVSEGREYCGALGQTLTEVVGSPAVGGNESNVVIPPPPICSVGVAYWHDHGSETNAYIESVFSPTDVASGQILASRPGFDAKYFRIYLITPDGTILRYDVATGRYYMKLPGAKRWTEMSQKDVEKRRQEEIAKDKAKKEKEKEAEEKKKREAEEKKKREKERGGGLEEEVRKMKFPCNTNDSLVDLLFLGCVFAVIMLGAFVSCSSKEKTNKGEILNKTYMANDQNERYVDLVKLDLNRRGVQYMNSDGTVVYDFVVESNGDVVKVVAHPKIDPDNPRLGGCLEYRIRASTMKIEQFLEYK